MLVTEGIAADKTEIINRPGEAGAVLLTNRRPLLPGHCPVTNKRPLLPGHCLVTNRRPLLPGHCPVTNGKPAADTYTFHTSWLLQISLRFVPSCRYFLVTVIELFQTKLGKKRV